MLTKLGPVPTESTPSTDSAYTDKGISAGVLTAVPVLNVPVDTSLSATYLLFIQRCWWLCIFQPSSFEDETA